MTVEQTIEEREPKYGNYPKRACLAESINDLLTCGSMPLKPFQKHALTMIAEKLSRITNGDPNIIDNWHDIAGYATLVERELRHEQANAAQLDLINTVLPEMTQSTLNVDIRPSTSKFISPHESISSRGPALPYDTYHLAIQSAASRWANGKYCTCPTCRPELVRFQRCEHCGVNAGRPHLSNCTPNCYQEC